MSTDDKVVETVVDEVVETPPEYSYEDLPVEPEPTGPTDSDKMTRALQDQNELLRRRVEMAETQAQHFQGLLSQRREAPSDTITDEEAEEIPAGVGKLLKQMLRENADMRREFRESQVETRKEQIERDIGVAYEEVLTRYGGIISRYDVIDEKSKNPGLTIKGAGERAANRRLKELKAAGYVLRKVKTQESPEHPSHRDLRPVASWERKKVAKNSEEMGDHLDELIRHYGLAE